MKKCLIAIALFVVIAVVSAAETAVMKYAPASAVVAAEINIDKILQQPSVLKVINKPENVAKRKAYEEKSGMRLTDLKTIWLFADQNGSGIAICRLTHKPDLESLFGKAGISYSKDRAGGKVVYHLNTNGTSGKLDVSVLEPGLLAVGQSGKVRGYLKGKRGNCVELEKVVKTIPAGVVSWLAFVNQIKLADGTSDDPQQLYLTFDFAGKNQEDLDFKFRIVCSSGEGANMMAARIPMFVMMGGALVFSKEPELGNQIAACVERKVDGTVVAVNAYIPKDLVRQVSEYFEKNAASFISQKKSKRQPAPRLK